MQSKEKLDKSEFVKVRNFWASKNTNKTVKRHPGVGIFAVHMSGSNT